MKEHMAFFPTRFCFLVNGIKRCTDAMVQMKIKGYEILTLALLQSLQKTNKCHKRTSTEDLSWRRWFRILTSPQSHSGDPKDSWLLDPRFYCMQRIPPTQGLDQIPYLEAAESPHSLQE